MISRTFARVLLIAFIVVYIYALVDIAKIVSHDPSPLLFLAMFICIIMVTGFAIILFKIKNKVK